MSAVVAVLYLICLLALPAFAIFVFFRGPHGQINRLFAWLSLALWVCVAKLFAFNLQIRIHATLTVHGEVIQTAMFTSTQIKMAELAVNLRVSSQYLKRTLKDNKLNWSLAVQMTKLGILVQTLLYAVGSGTPTNRHAARKEAACRESRTKQRKL